MTVMKLLVHIFLVLSCLILAAGCRSGNGFADPGLKYPLRCAGDNRAELEKVLDRYSANPEDSLKYKAAVFLIRNMPGHSYYVGRQIEQYMEYFPLLRETMQAGEKPAAAADSIIRKYGELDYSELTHLKDIETVDSSYLCDNIEWAFKVWTEQPWGKNVGFEDFCEYILPYRVGNEKLAYWRKNYYEKFNKALDSLRASDGPEREDPVNAAKCLTEYISKTCKPYFTTYVPAAMPHVGPETAMCNTGSCREFADLILYACRSVGIPCARDYVYVSGDANSGHSWVSFSDKDGRLFFIEDKPPVRLVEDSYLYRRPKGKVYRQTFSKDSVKAAFSRALTASEISEIMYDTDAIDVTCFYSGQYADSLEIQKSFLYDGARDLPGVIYLCMSSGMQWIPTDWTSPDKGKIIFRNVGMGNVFRLISFRNGRKSYLTDPFYIGEKGGMHLFRPEDGKTQDMTVYSKYPPMYTVSMSLGRFEGSRYADFRTPERLYTIPAKPYRLRTAIELSDTGPYRYIRYYGPSWGHCNVSEICYYDSAGCPLKGNPIGTPDSIDEEHGYEKAYDGSTLTSFSCKSAAGGWTGLDFGKPVNISKIVFSPRNRDNFVKEGNDYELFYYDRTWKSAGRMTAVSDSLVFKDVPSGTLYLLKNHSGGVQERVFSYKDGRQLWNTDNEKWFQ